MHLFIDTTEYGKVTFVLSALGKKDFTKSFPVKPQESSRILTDLEKFLMLAKIKNPPAEIKRLVVYKGSGSFTGLRIGAAVAQGLSLAWQVPVKVVKKQS